MDDMAELALEGASYGIDNFDRVYDPLKAKVQNMHSPIGGSSKSRGSDPSRYRDEYDDKPPSEEPIDRRGSRQDDGRRAVERGDRNGRNYVKETYYRESGRAKSAGRDGYGAERWSRDPRGRGPSQSSSIFVRYFSLTRRVLLSQSVEMPHEISEANLLSGRRDPYQSDSTSSASPPRRRRASARAIEGGLYDFRDGPPPRAQTFADDYSQKSRMPAGYLGAPNQEFIPSDQVVSTRRDPAWSEFRGSKRSSSVGSSSSSTTLPSSSEDEREIKRMKGKEYLSAGLAAVATIHAVSGVMSSLEARDKRHLELAKGEITHEEARRKRNKLRLQDAAAIGIAALGIKGAYSEWQEVQESRQEVKKKDQEREERHKRRVRRAERNAREAGKQGYGGRDEYRDGDRRDRRDRRDGYRSA